MVDYRISDGANARTWVQVEVAEGAGSVTLPQHTQLLSQVATLPRVLLDPSPDYTAALAAGPTVFETMEERTFRDTLNRFDFYAWGDRQCCLPAGRPRPACEAGTTISARATCWSSSSSADRGPGSPADADPAHRHAVRLSRGARP